MTTTGHSLQHMLSVLEDLAPLDLAEAWDNTGLLIDPGVRKAIGKVLLTLDLTLPVIQEAKRVGAALVVAYHPPLFEPVRQLCSNDPGQRVLIEAIRAGIAVYAPHTALDAAPGGLADWLSEMLGPGTVTPLDGNGAPGIGPGRRVRLDPPLSFPQLVKRIKTGLGLDQVKTSRIEKHQQRGALIRTVALCPGAGASLLLQTKADLLLTGEMKHHDVLAATARGSSVILCGHAESERGYLKIFRRKLKKAMGGGLEVETARSDRGPLQTR